MRRLFTMATAVAAAFVLFSAPAIAQNQSGFGFGVVEALRQQWQIGAARRGYAQQPSGGTQPSVAPANNGATTPKPAAKPAPAPVPKDAVWSALIVAADYGTLANVSRDAREAIALLEQGGVEPVVLSDDPELSEQAPTKSAVENAFRTAAQSQCDLLFVWLAGSGVVSGVQPYFRTTDADAKNGFVAMQTLISALRNARAKHVVFVVDAARDAAGDFNGALARYSNWLTKAQGGTFSMITSASAGETSGTMTGDDVRDAGIFAHYFINGVASGRADVMQGFDGCTTLVEAFNYAYAKTVRESNWTQHPEFMTTSSYNNLPVLTRAAWTEWSDAGERFDSLDSWKNQEEFYSLLLDAARWELVQRPDAMRVVTPKTSVERSKASENGGAARAEIYMTEAIRMRPTDPEPRLLRGCARRMRGDFAGARKDFESVGEKLELFVKQSGELRNFGDPQKGTTGLGDESLIAVSDVNFGKEYIAPKDPNDQTSENDLFDAYILIKYDSVNGVPAGNKPPLVMSGVSLRWDPERAETVPTKNVGSRLGNVEKVAGRVAKDGALLLRDQKEKVVDLDLPLLTLPE